MMSEPVRALKYFPNNSYLLLAAFGTKIFKVNTKSQEVSLFSSAHVNEVAEIDINSTGSLILTASRDLSCFLWDYKTATVLKRFTEFESVISAVKFHPNGFLFVTGSSDYEVCIMDMNINMCTHFFTGPAETEVSLLDCCPNKNVIASAGDDCFVRLWDVETNELLCEVQCYEGNIPDDSRITALCFRDDNSIAICSNKGVFRIWDIWEHKIVYNTVFDDIPLLLKITEDGIWHVIFKTRD